MNRKLLIFDLDGTLSDTQPLLHTMVYRALLDSGIDAGSPENVTKLLHKNGKHIFEGHQALIPLEFAESVDSEKYGADFWHYYDSLFMESVNRVFDGMHEALKELKSRGYVLTVLSNKKDHYVKPIISTAFGDTFSLVIGRSPDRAKKPEPDGIFYICEQLGIAPADTCMIGDLAADYLASKSAGANHIIANWGYGHEKGLRKQGATVFADKPLDILEILK